MSNENLCAECSAPLPANLPKGLCSHCALSGALELAEHITTAGPPESQTAESTRNPSIRSFGDYELLEEIARGGMGIVFKARQVSLDRIVAVKVLLLGQYASEEFIHRFRIEASTAASLQHPNIVAIHEVGVHQGQHYFAMDLVDGPNLARLLRDGALPAKRAAGYVKTIAEAIHFAHSRRILHRDLKPSNVLIDSNDQPRVTDFGLAKNLANDSGLTVTGQVYGSPSFMPPEQASGQRGKMGVASDVYSLGAILYHALTGRPPFVGESVAQTLRQVENDEPLSPRILNPAVPRDLETICLKCLEKVAQRRYATALELAEELGRFLNNEPVHAHPTGPFLRSVRWARRNPAGAGLIGALVLGLGVLSGLVKILDDGRRSDQEAITSIRAMVVGNIEELWQRPDKTLEPISSEQLAALAGKRKSADPAGALRLKVGLGASVKPVDRATTYQPMLDFLERKMEQALRRPVRLDLVLFKGERRGQQVAQHNLDLARMGTLDFFRARETNPKLVPLVQENSPKDAVIFALTRSGITNLSQVRSIAFADTNSTISAWAKVFLVRAGIRAVNLSYHSNLTSQIVLPDDRDNDFHSHKEALQAVLDGRFDAGVARPKHVITELGAEGKDWVSLLKFESSQTLWVAGGSMTGEVRQALKSALLTLSEQQSLPLPERVKNLIDIDTNSLLELEEALDRDLRLFDSPAAPGSELKERSR